MVVDDALRNRILAATVTAPPADLGVTHWSSRLLADRFGVHHSTIARMWADYGLKPHRVGTFKFSTDPELEANRAQYIRGAAAALIGPSRLVPAIRILGRQLVGAIFGWLTPTRHHGGLRLDPRAGS